MWVLNLAILLSFQEQSRGDKKRRERSVEGKLFFLPFHYELTWGSQGKPVRTQKRGKEEKGKEKLSQDNNGTGYARWWWLESRKTKGDVDRTKYGSNKLIYIRVGISLVYLIVFDRVDVMQQERRDTTKTREMMDRRGRTNQYGGSIMVWWLFGGKTWSGVKKRVGNLSPIGASYLGDFLGEVKLSGELDTPWCFLSFCVGDNLFGVEIVSLCERKRDAYVSIQKSGDLFMPTEKQVKSIL